MCCRKCSVIIRVINTHARAHAHTCVGIFSLSRHGFGNVPQEGVPHHLEFVNSVAGVLPHTVVKRIGARATQSPPISFPVPSPSNTREDHDTMTHLCGPGAYAYVPGTTSIPLIPPFVKSGCIHLVSRRQILENFRRSVSVVAAFFTRMGSSRATRPVSVPT